MMVSGIFRQRFDIIQSVNIEFLNSVLFTSQKGIKNLQMIKVQRLEEAETEIYEAFGIEVINRQTNQPHNLGSKSSIICG